MRRADKAERRSAVGEKTAALLELTSTATPAAAALWEEHGRIRALLDEIRQLQEAPPLRPDGWRRSTALEPFVAWAKDRGVLCHGVQVREASELGGEEFGLFAAADEGLKGGAVAVEVPRRAMLSWEGAAESKALKAGMERDPLLKGMENVGLAIALLHETMRGAESAFAPYVAFLPAQHSSPLFYQPSELETLRGSPVFAGALGLFRSVARQFAYFHQRLVAPDNVNPLVRTSLTAENFSFDAYRWAVATVSTRINYIPAKGRDGPGRPALIPLLDLANHDSAAAPPDYHVDRDAALLLPHKDLPKDAPLCISYGRRTNGELLLHGGFVPSALNPHDGTRLRLGLAKNDAQVEKRRVLLAKLGLQEQMEFPLRRIRPIVEEAMLDWVRVFVGTEPVLSLAAAAGDPALLAADIVTERKVGLPDRRIRPILEEAMLDWVRVFVGTEPVLSLAAAAGDPALLAADIVTERKVGLPDRRIRPILEEAMLDWVRVFVGTEPVLSLAAAAGDPALLAADIVTERKAWEFIASRCGLLQRAYRSGAETQPTTPKPVRLLIHSELRLLAGAAEYAGAKAKALGETSKPKEGTAA